jgi:hypothetical protein
MTAACARDALSVILVPAERATRGMVLVLPLVLVFMLAALVPIVIVIGAHDNSGLRDLGLNNSGLRDLSRHDGAGPGRGRRLFLGQRLTDRRAGRTTYASADNGSGAAAQLLPDSRPGTAADGAADDGARFARSGGCCRRANTAPDSTPDHSAVLAAEFLANEGARSTAGASADCRADIPSSGAIRHEGQTGERGGQ